MCEDDPKDLNFEDVGEDSLEDMLVEVRRSNERLVNVLEETDDKAMRTSRTSLIVVGLLLTALSMGGFDLLRSAGTVANLLALGGVISLVVSTLLTMAAYSVSEYPAGVGENHVRFLSENKVSLEGWRARLIRDYLEWNDETEDAVVETVYMFFLGQVTLLLGIGLLSFLAVTVFLAELLGKVGPPNWLIAVIFLFLGLATVIIGSTLWDTLTES